MTAAAARAKVDGSGAARAKNAERKREKAEQELVRLRQTEDDQRKKLQKLQSDLETVQRAANAAQGEAICRL